VIYVDITTGEVQTYGEIRAASERIGRTLRNDWQWQKGDVMAIFSPNSADIGSMTFGVLWAGGIICPINNLCKTDELTSYLKSSEAKGLVTHASCLDVAQDAARAAGLSLDRIVLVGASHPQGKEKHVSSLRPTALGVGKMAINPSEDLAFLVYSSGTTGLPKGVMLSHENMVVNALQNNSMDEGNTHWKSDRTIGFLPMYHIYGKYDDCCFRVNFSWKWATRLTQFL
jgi:4-coumarate--CoA ligase